MVSTASESSPKMFMPALGSVLDLTSENRDIMLSFLLNTLKAQGKPTPHVAETRTTPRGKPWHKLSWDDRDVVIKIDNRGYWQLQEGHPPRSVGTFAQAADLV